MPSLLTELETPCLVLDRAKVARNVRRLAERLARASMPLRPHVKTAKAPEVVSMAVAGQPGGITVSTLAEAEAFFELGYRDIVYAVGMAPAKIPRAAALRKRGAELTLLADDVEQARAIGVGARSHGLEFPVLIEIDSDGLRAGVRPDSNALLEVGRTLHETRGTSLAGVLTHAGGSYACRSPEALADMAETERLAVVTAAERLRRAGLPAAIVSAGSTPTASFAPSYEGLSEVRAGVYVFQDLVMSGLGVCSLDDVALSVLASVIGQQRDRNTLVIDAGWTALSRDRGTADQALDQGYGLICDERGTPIEDLIVTGTSQEHGLVSDRQGRALDLGRFPVGTRLRILPNHACATAAAHDGYHVVDGGIAVVARWERCRGW